jgi:hypothetical protein
VPHDDSEEENKPLPPNVERALAEARASAKKAGRGRLGAPIPGTGAGGWLALIPVVAALLASLLMLPRSAQPDEIPLPLVDTKELGAIVADDASRAAAVGSKPLGSDVRAVGSALRAFNKAMAKSDGQEALAAARLTLTDAVGGVIGGGGDAAQGYNALRTLRAVQLVSFLAEVKRFESTGKVSDELDEVAGGFVPRMAAAGWIQGNTVLLDEAELRVSYKLVWAATVGVDRVPGLALALDEQRVLYRFYLTHPHASELERQSFADQRRNAKSNDECNGVIARENGIVEQWRIEKIKRLGQIDPAYPTEYALGVAYYRAGRFEQSVDQLRAWVDKHPSGALSLRARNHLKAALGAYGPS